MTGGPSFRDELAALEEVVRALEAPDLDLDRALALFDEGVRRLQAAKVLLERSELSVKRVLEAADGTLKTKPLDD
jgi:exodeoxyribonuclease VII small subunit